MLHTVEVVGLAPGTSYLVNVISSSVTGLATERANIVTPPAPAFIDLTELMAISNFGGDIRANAANLIRQRLGPAAADAAISAVVIAQASPPALRSSRARSIRDWAITMSPLPPTGLEAQATQTTAALARRLLTSRHVAGEAH